MGDEVFETYETRWRGIEAMLPTLQLLDHARRVSRRAKGVRGVPCHAVAIWLPRQAQASDRRFMYVFTWCRNASSIARWLRSTAE